MVYSESAPEWLRSIPAVDTMRQIWVQQYYIEEGVVNWRTKGNIPPPAVMISSPHDVDVRFCTNKRDKTWEGYKVHLTETCDRNTPNLITSVQTTASTVSDNNVTEKIHCELNDRELCPSEHLFDTGYGSVDLLLSSRGEYGIELICPMRPDNSWQSRTEGAFDISRFTIDWENQKVICPQGKVSVYWKDTKRYDQPKILAKFHKSDCQACPSKTLCTRSQIHGHRELTFSPKEEHMTLQESRQFQKTPEFKERHTQRAGIEGTISQAVYALGMRRCRYRGLAKTNLQHVLTTCAINLKRVVDWLNEKPRSKTRKSRFAALAA